MKITEYIIEIKSRINEIESYISNPLNTDEKNPFTKPNTYVWIENDKN